ncbi:MAG: carboxypeptidase regulatory-like domain-containing protein [Gemmatimonadaceae bacterium]|nr:carboxypeptidase regulatory-like domain-containing protein [Gemmatimonadaceae bacterium]
MRRILRWIPTALAAVALVAVTTSARAQDAQPVTGAISGVVRDDVGRPVEGAEVLVMQLRTRVRSRADGAFTVDQLANGKYTLQVRRVGFAPASVKVSVKDGAGTVAIVLKRVPFSLPSVVTVAARGGLSGVVADTGYRPLGGVKVQVVGTNQSVETDSVGAFFLPVRAGTYMVVLRRGGFRRQVVSVTVPKDTGRKIAAWMLPETKDSDPRYGAMLFDQNLRVLRAAPATSKFFSREDIERLGFTDLRAIGSFASGHLMNPDCPVMENGDPKRTLPLWAITAKDLEFVEAYINPGVRTTVRPNGGGAADKFEQNKREMAVVPPSDCGVSLVVWWRK